MGYEEMKDIKVSLIGTLKNEEASIKEFLDSLLAQSRPADEIIIVDGGSTDRTLEIINTYIEKGAPIKLIVDDGANIAEGRNIAITNVKYDLIASTDAGCKLDKDWLKNLIKPFEEDPSVDVVSGWYEADARTDFEECVAELTYPKLERVMKNLDTFLPSSRSVAYKKGAWEKVGGYPEWLYTAEDTLFDLNLKKVGCKLAFAKDAVVYWKVRSKLGSVFKQTFSYQRGDGHAGLPSYRTFWRKYVIYGIGCILLVVGFVFNPVWILLLICSLIYLLRPAVKIYKKVNTPIAIFMTPLIILAVDLGVIFGYFVGSMERVLNQGKE